MIKINFIANEITREKYAKIKKYATIGYATAWLISITVVLIQFRGQQSSVRELQNEIHAIKLGIEKVSPQFQQAVSLYQQRNKHRKKLAALYASTVETSFVIESLENLTQTLPKNFWLQNVHITTQGGKKTDNKRKSKSMVIRGNVFLDMADENQDHMNKFHKALTGLRPYSLAESKLDPKKMKVSKLKDRYFHNFEIAFSWPDFIL